MNNNQSKRDIASVVVIGALLLGGIYIFLTVGAYVLGWIFAAGMVPAYSYVCSAEKVNLMTVVFSKPPSSDDYSTFLHMGQCSLSDVLVIRCPYWWSCLDESYRGMHPYFNDDPVGNFFSTMGNIFVSHFSSGRNDGAYQLPRVLNIPLLRFFFGALYLVAVAVFNIILGKWAYDVYIWLKKKWTSQP